MADLVPYAGELRTKVEAMRTRGHEEAAAHRPPASANAPDRHEAEVVVEANRFLATEKHIFQQELSAHSATAVQVGQDAADLPGRLDRVLEDGLLPHTIAAAQTESRPALVAVAERRMRLATDYRGFRERNAITEEPAYPESHIWHVALVAGFALIETVVNAFFYENSQGLLGGFFVALGVSVVNMSGAGVLGYFFAFKNLKSRNSRMVGFGALAAFVLLSIYCNALFAAFRSEYQLLQDPSDPMQLRRAFQLATSQAARVFWLGMHFGDLNSFLLFGVGILLSALAFYKGYTFDDKYPGHGAKHRALRKAADAEGDLRQAVRAKLKDLAQKARLEVQSVQRAAGELVSRAGSRLGQLHVAIDGLSRRVRTLEGDLRLLLEAYRSANAAVRQATRPAYFDQYPELSIADCERDFGALKALLVDAQRGAAATGEAYQRRLNEKLNEVVADGVAIDAKFDQFCLTVDTSATQLLEHEPPRPISALVR